MAEQPSADLVVGQLDSRTLIELRTLTRDSVSLSPDGRLLVFQVRQASLDANTYTAQWLVMPADGSKPPSSIGDAGDPLLFRAAGSDGLINGSWYAEPPLWSADSRIVCYRKRLDGATQVWCSERLGTAIQVTRNAADVEEISWAGRERKLLFKVDVPRAERARAEQAAGESGYLYDPLQPWSALAAKPFYARYSLAGGTGKVWAYDFTQGIERPAAYGETAVFVGDAGADTRPAASFAPDARVVARARNGAVAWLAADTPGQQGVIPPLTLHASRFTDGGRARPCRFDPCQEIPGIYNIELHWSADGTEIYFSRREGPNRGRIVWYAWDFGRDRLRQVIDLSNEGISSCRFHADRAFCLRQPPTYPATLVAIDLQTARIETIVDPNPHFKQLRLGSVERLEWSDQKGHATYGFLAKPRDYVAGTRYPLIITGYRAAEAFHGAVGDEYPTHLFSAQGFAVLVYDMPEAWDVMARADAVGAAVETWNGERFELSATLSVLEAAIDLLDRRGLIDPARVGIGGLSAGAGQVNYAIRYSTRFRAAIMSQPPWSRLHYVLSSSGALYRSILRRIGLGPPGSGNDATVNMLGLALHPEQMSTPLLINASDEEYLPALETAVLLGEAMKPVELRVYPGEYHIKWYPRHRWHIYERNLDWFSFWLQGVERAGSGDPGQLARWRRMRAGSAPSGAGAVMAPP